MNDGVNVTSNEWSQWADYYAKLFPGASKTFIEDMTGRMIRTLSYCGIPTRMDWPGYHRRLIDLRDALRGLPDDSIQGGEDGRLAAG